MTTRTTYSPSGIRNEEEYWLFEACEDYADYKMTLVPHSLDNFSEVLADCKLRAYRYYASLGYNAMSLYHRIYG